MIVLDSRHATELMVGVQEASMARGNANVRFPLDPSGFEGCNRDVFLDRNGLAKCLDSFDFVHGLRREI